MMGARKERRQLKLLEQASVEDGVGEGDGGTGWSSE